jgi:hypothetical protein
MSAAEGINRLFNAARDQLIALEGLEAELAQARVALEAARAETVALRKEAETCEARWRRCVK